MITYISYNIFPQNTKHKTQMSDLPTYELEQLPPYSVFDSSKRSNKVYDYINNRMPIIKLLLAFINSHCFLSFNIFRICVGIIFWNDTCEDFSKSPYDINIKFREINVIMGSIHTVIGILLITEVFKYFVHIKNRKLNPEKIFTLFQCKNKCVMALIYFFVFMTPLFTCTMDLLVYTANYNTICSIIITIPSIMNAIYLYSIVVLIIIFGFCYCCTRMFYDWYNA